MKGGSDRDWDFPYSNIISLGLNPATLSKRTSLARELLEIRLRESVLMKDGSSPCHLIAARFGRFRCLGLASDAAEDNHCHLVASWHFRCEAQTLHHHRIMSNSHYIGTSTDVQIAAMERALADLRYDLSRQPMPTANLESIQAYMCEYIESMSPMLRHISLQLCSMSL
jgi:hypothetical protein